MYQSPALTHALSHDSITTGYCVQYACACGTEWEARWSCACDDECPDCGSTVQADDWHLDGTYTEGQLDAYNLTGVMPAA